MSTDSKYDFQTPLNICRYMSSMVTGVNNRILEPTPGSGNLVSTLDSKGTVEAPVDFWPYWSRHWEENIPRYDWVVMNPPFTPMSEGYNLLDHAYFLSDNIIALMPYLTIINGEKRLQSIMDHGLKSITHLPRSVFKGSRVQTCVLEIIGGYQGPIEFKKLPVEFQK